jgi:ribosomal protein S15P/S13E
MSKEEVEKLVTKTYGPNASTSQVGIILRDKYGVPDITQVTGKKVTEILRDSGTGPKLPEDLTNLIRKAIGLHKHMVENHKDLHNKRALQLPSRRSGPGQVLPQHRRPADGLGILPGHCGDSHIQVNSAQRG